MSITTDGPMTETGLTSSFEREIPSDFAVGKQLIDELLVELGKLDWMEPDVFAVHLAVEEALVNAIKHGNQNDEDKKVFFSVNATPSSVRIKIVDEGSGFDPGEVPDPTDDDNLEVPSGRGLMLMRSFMSSVVFNATGNEVVMEKRIGEHDEDEHDEDEHDEDGD